jgi:DNA-binding response OmpR family regulator
MSHPLLVIIDDEEDLLDLLTYNFERHGYQVAAFDRAAAAQEFIAQRRPDLVLCDWMMPEMTGLALCKQLKDSLDWADLPFVMLTCRTERSAKRQALAAGVTDFITKPVGMQQLLSQVDNILAGQMNSAEEAS